MSEKDGEDRDYELFRDWENAIVTASGFLVTVPLLALSILSTSPLFSRSEIQLVAIPTLLSAICFAASIYMMSESLGERNSPLAGFYLRWGPRSFTTGIALLVAAISVVVLELL